MVIYVMPLFDSRVEKPRNNFTTEHLNSGSNMIQKLENQIDFFTVSAYNEQSSFGFPYVFFLCHVIKTTYSIPNTVVWSGFLDFDHMFSLSSSHFSWIIYWVSSWVSTLVVHMWKMSEWVGRDSWPQTIPSKS